MHKTHRADGNQEKIVDALRALGVNVLVLSQVAYGCPDLLCAGAGKTMLLMEIKMPGEGLSSEQVIWRDDHPNMRVVVVHSVDEAIAEMNKAVRR